MTSINFAYWLQGFFEIGNPKTLNEEQTEMIKNHLKLIFVDGVSKNSDVLSPTVVPPKNYGTCGVSSSITCSSTE